MYRWLEHPAPRPSPPPPTLHTPALLTHTHTHTLYWFPGKRQQPSVLHWGPTGGEPSAGGFCRWYALIYVAAQSRWIVMQVRADCRTSFNAILKSTLAKVKTSKIKIITECQICVGASGSFVPLLHICAIRTKIRFLLCVVKPLKKLGMAILEGLALILVHILHTTRLMLHIMVNYCLILAAIAGLTEKNI